MAAAAPVPAEASAEGGETEAAGAGGRPGVVVPGLPWAYTSDDSIAFNVDCIVQGDLLVSVCVDG